MLDDSRSHHPHDRLTVLRDEFRKFFFALFKLEQCLFFPFVRLVFRPDHMQACDMPGENTVHLQLKLMHLAGHVSWIDQGEILSILRDQISVRQLAQVRIGRGCLADPHIDTALLGVPCPVNMVFGNGGKADFLADKLNTFPFVLHKQPERSVEQERPEDKGGHAPAAEMLEIRCKCFFHSKEVEGRKAGRRK